VQAADGDGDATRHANADNEEKKKHGAGSDCGAQQKIEENVVAHQDQVWSGGGVWASYQSDTAGYSWVMTQRCGCGNSAVASGAGRGDGGSR
jgi:hypothetical protein